MPPFGSYLLFILDLLLLVAEFIYLNTLLGAAGAGELNQDYDDDLSYDNHSYPGSRPTIFECPLGMAILELLVLYLMHRDGYDEPMHSLFYILVLD